MGVLLRNEDFVGGIDSSLVSKIGTTPLNTTAQNLSGAINEHELAIIDIIANKVSKSGDTMTGNLRLKNSNITLDTSANNHLNNDTWYGYSVIDSANIPLSNFYLAAYTSGATKTYMQVYNKKTDGTSVDAQFGLMLEKSGTLTYVVSEPARLKTAIGGDYPTGFSFMDTSQGWGEQSGTFLTGWNAGDSCSVAWRKNCPSAGKLSCIIDGYFYQNEGNYRCLDTSGGTATGNIWVSKTGSEAEMGVTNGTSGKNCYMYSNTSGSVGLYSNIGTNLIACDSNKKITIGGTSYSIGNAANFRSALGLGALALNSGAHFTTLAVAAFDFKAETTNKSYSVTASKSGWTFLCWVAPYSTGHTLAGECYFEYPQNATTRIWAKDAIFTANSTIIKGLALFYQSGGLEIIV